MYVPSIRTGYQYRHIWTHLSLCWRTAHSIILLLLIIIAVIIICITNTQHCFALIVTLLFFLKFKEFYHIILLVPHFAYALHSAITADKQLTIPVWVTGIDLLLAYWQNWMKHQRRCLILGKVRRKKETIMVLFLNFCFSKKKTLSILILSFSILFVK